MDGGRRRAGGVGLLRRGPVRLRRPGRALPQAPIVVDDAGAGGGAAAGSARGSASSGVRRGRAEAIDALSRSRIDLPGGAGCRSARLRRWWRSTSIRRALRTGGGKAHGHVALNRAVLPALARQIRLRNLSGGILVDLAGLSPRRRAALGPELGGGAGGGSLRPRLLGFTALGLAEIVRPRVHPPLHELLAGPHAAGLAALRAMPPRRRRPHAWRRCARRLRCGGGATGDEVALEGPRASSGRPLMLRSNPGVQD